MIDPGMEYVPPPNVNVSRKKLRPPHTFIKREADSEEDEGHDQEGRCEESADCEAPPSSSRGGGGGGVVERRRTTVPEKSDAVAAPEGPRFSPLSLYEERLLLRRMDACQLALAVTPQAKRLYRKLLIRHAKRQRGLPLFDIDRAVSATLSLVGGVYGTQEVDSRVGGGVKGTFCTSSQEERILDRFQVAGTRTSWLFRRRGSLDSTDLFRLCSCRQTRRVDQASSSAPCHFGIA